MSSTTEAAFRNARIMTRAEAEDWPEPAPLPDGLPPVAAFDPDLLPAAIRPYVMDIAERLQCPPDFPAVAAMIGLAAVVGRQIAIRPKRQDDWTVVPNLWGAVVGQPSVIKTPALQEPLRPLFALEGEAARVHENEKMAWDTNRLVQREAAKVGAEQIRKAIKNNGDPHAIARGVLDGDPEEPVRRRYIVNDSTVEKIGEILRDNPRGVLIFRDELSGFLRSMEREGHEGDRAFYLESWNGNGHFTYDRIGRGTVEIEAACVSILGGIQPGPLAAYMTQMVRSGHGDDGFIQRFQMLVYPDVSRHWVNVDRRPDKAAQDRACAIYGNLDRLDPSGIGAAYDSGDPIPFLRFSPDAQDAFDELRAELEKRLRSGDEHPVMEAHLAKYRSLVPSLALLCHLAEGHVGPVTLESLVRAAAWTEYLETHARRIFSPAISPDLDAARALGEHIRRGDLKSPFSVRDVYRAQWSGLTTRADAVAAVNVLEDHAWLRVEEIPTAGRAKTICHINPRLTEAGR